MTLNILDFNIWQEVSFDEADKVRVELQHFLERLQAQHEKSKGLQPSALDFFVRDPDALSSVPTYHLRHHEDFRYLLWHLRYRNTDEILILFREE